MMNALTAQKIINQLDDLRATARFRVPFGEDEDEDYTNGLIELIQYLQANYL